MSVEDHDKDITHCRMLGHEVPFSYCRKGATNQPCRKIFDCWFHGFDIVEFMQEYYSEQELKSMLSLPKDKIGTLFDMIKKAQDGMV
jgi:hypothetical protein